MSRYIDLGNWSNNLPAPVPTYLPDPAPTYRASICDQDGRCLHVAGPKPIKVALMLGVVGLGFGAGYALVRSLDAPAPARTRRRSPRR